MLALGDKGQDEAAGHIHAAIQIQSRDQRFKRIGHHSDRVARGEGRSKKAAEQCAAKEALKLLGVIKEK